MNKNNTSHVVLLVILIIIAIVMIVFSYLKPSKVEYNTNNNQTTKEVEKPKEKSLTSEQVQLRQRILTLINKKTVLTKAEKDEIFNAISGSNINNYNFSKEERIKIVEALNRK